MSCFFFWQIHQKKSAARVLFARVVIWCMCQLTRSWANALLPNLTASPFSFASWWDPEGKDTEARKNCLQLPLLNKDRGCQSSEGRKRAPLGGRVTQDQSGSKRYRRLRLVSLLCFTPQALVFCWRGCTRQQMMVVITAAGGPEHSRALTPPTPRCNSHVLTSNEEHKHQWQLLSMNVLARPPWC